MAKSRQRRALFELLAKEHGPQAAKPVVPVRPAGTAAASPPAPVSAPAAAGRPEAAMKPVARASPEALFAAGRVTVTYYQVAVAVLVAACLCVVSFVAGMHWDGGLRLPVTQPKPTFEDIQKGAPTAGLVKPRPDDTALGGAEHPNDTGGVGAKTAEGGPEHAVAPAKGRTAVGGADATGEAGGKFRLRIAQLKISDASATDRLRAFLSQNGVETELTARRGLQFLYSQAKFVKESDEKAKAFRDKVIGLLKAFKQQTGIQTSTDPYFVTVE
jgi:hypothetical protein